jgi:hypothetical protein
MTIRRVSRRKQLLDDTSINKKPEYWKLKAEALDRIPWIGGCERGYEIVFKDTTA